MKIMQIVSGPMVNGAVVHCLLLSRELARRGHDVAVVCRQDSWIRNQLAADRIEVIECDQHRWPTDELKRIHGIVAQRQIDVVHTHMSRAHFFGVLLRRAFGGVPTVATAHSQHFQLHWMLNDHVIAPSQATADFSRRFNLVADKRIEVIHNFIDWRRFAEPSRNVRQRLRAELHADDQTVVIGVVGDVIERKGMKTLVEALPAILQVHPHVRVVSIGKCVSDYAARVRTLAEELGVADRVKMLGIRHDVADLLCAMDVFALPSRDEQMPIAVLEAMAAGLPIVATTVGGLPECVLDNETGMLVPPDDVPALIQALLPLVRDADLRATWGKAGRERVRRHFSPASQVVKIERVYERLAQSKLRRAA